MTASIGSMRKSNFQHSLFSCSKLGRCTVSPSRGTGAAAFLDEEMDDVTSKSSFASSGSLVVDIAIADGGGVCSSGEVAGKDS
jgi:hypothetical protein